MAGTISHPDLQLDPNLVPVYANIARISHSPMEMVLEFARMLPGESNASIHTRLVMSPVAAKMFLRALGENLSRYEASFGEINIPGDSSLASNLFGTVNPPPKPK